MIRLSVPVTLRVKGRDGQATVWLRPMTAREQMRYDRDLRRAIQAEEDSSALMLEVYIATIVGQIVRVEVEGEDFPPLPEEGRDAWVDALGIEAITTMVTVCVQKLEEDDDGLGKSTSGAPSPRREALSAIDVLTRSGPSADAASPSPTLPSVRSETAWSRLARWIWKWLTGTGAPSRTGSSSRAET